MSLLNLNSRLLVCYIGYCLLFLAFAVLFQLGAYWQRKDRESVSGLVKIP